ncbi:MAG: neutral/alkaline non-lysosomal ceramidase N-terminal domain-containing protein [Sandaracinaceae bacterium]|nr:neutral/alkaline non-lysosomal ceramidase N-terminal domain-containing protein [Sandaracinaceae bacterium]
MRLLPCLTALLLVACDGAAPPADDAGVDAGPREPPQPASTAHCQYADLPPTAGAGGTVRAGAIEVGLAELALDLPIGVALGGNTSRAAPIDNQGYVDRREVYVSGSFTPSVGIETIPKVKAVAIRAGDETIVLLRTDTIFADDTITHEVTSRLGPELAGKVLWTTTHSHTAPEQYSADRKLQVGGGPVRGSVRAQLIDRMTQAAQQALASMVPARIGVATQTGFDPDDRVSYDRRPENDFLHPGRSGKDDDLAVIRIDAMDGTPMAILPIFGVHSAILDDDVSVFSTDASGMFERMLEEELDHEVMVVHLQGAAGDVLGASEGHLAYEGDEPRWDFARNEECGRWALPQIRASAGPRARGRRNLRAGASPERPGRRGLGSHPGVDPAAAARAGRPADPPLVARVAGRELDGGSRRARRGAAGPLPLPGRGHRLLDRQRALRGRARAARRRGDRRRERPLDLRRRRAARGVEAAPHGGDHEPVRPARRGTVHGGAPSGRRGRSDPRRVAGRPGPAPGHSVRRGLDRSRGRDRRRGESGRAGPVTPAVVGIAEV